MSEGVSPIDDRPRQPTPSGSELLDVLGDECSRRIIVATSERPLTVKELTERCPVSSTTVYRRINRLVDLDLLHETPAFPANGASKKRYEATVDRIETTIDEEGFTVQTSRDRSDHDRIERLLSEAPTDRITATVEDGELRLSVPLTGRLFEAVAGDGTDREADDEE
ncbi:MAG: winged helix-turn-helix domain-containing protein [Haloferacaceae archaeon]